MEYEELKNRSFLGRGWAFPPTFSDAPNIGVEMVENEKDIKESLEILMNTNVGERAMLPEYGCKVLQFLFEAISNSKMHFLKELIRTAIIQYEPRVELNDIAIDHSDYQQGIIRVGIDYSVITTNTRFNLVFPYYKLEGTDLPKLYHKQIKHTLIAPL
ncbi:MAG TPA: hypothetical protein EYN07_07950 [Flavobacteriaceae bacterium]|mgnify:FL=1|jgi:hypothetical protein|nr:hypothetical protein [Flavobacteriaceae bacterium]HIN99158.1 hypothetical protein [Flavobacteriaceae bacterium]|tara:strand:- start:43796 stop:44269 length:474 start_codon:yes stop_codon:yes gene_type:complete